MIGLGTIVNAIAIIVGSALGLLVGSKFSKKYQESVTKVMGLCVTLIGLQMSLRFDNALILIGSISIGTLVGEWIGIEDLLEKFADKVKSKFRSASGTFSEGFVTATLLYCVGSMAIIGAIQDGAQSDTSVLYAKSLMDGIISIPLASTLGFGVLLSFFPVLVYQGLITLVAAYFGDVASAHVMNQLVAVGGVLILSLGLNLVGVAKLRVGNYLPALVLAVLFALIFPK